MFEKIQKLFKKEPKVIFQAKMPGIETFMPIIPASSYKPKWLATARSKYSEKLAGQQLIDRRYASVHRCPGIIDLMNSGWIVRAWQDFTIETNGDGGSFKWNASIDSKDYIGNDDIGHMLGHALTDYLPKRIDTLSTVIKFNSPWLVTVPKGWSLLYMPMLYSDDGRFTCCPGILDTEMDKHLNVQLFWHKLNSIEVIRAGTPLAHLVLMPTRKAMKMEIRPYTNDTPNLLFAETYRLKARYLYDYYKTSIIPSSKQ